MQHNFLCSLYKSLESSKTVVKSGASDRAIQAYEMKQTLERTAARPTMTFGPTQTQRNNKTAQFATLSTLEAKPPSTLSHKSEAASYSEYRTLKKEDVDRMPLDELKRFAKAMQAEIARCRHSEPLNPAGIREEKIAGLLQEREQWAKKLQMEEKQLADQQQILDALKAQGSTYTSKRGSNAVTPTLSQAL